MVAQKRKASSLDTNHAATREWEELTTPLSPWILDAVSSMGFTRMTPVQASTVPLFNGNKDVVVEAVTGSGKTLAFLIPVVERLLRLDEPVRKHHIGAIIISPTRELATQIYAVLSSLLAFHAPSAVHLDHTTSSPDQLVRSEFDASATDSNQGQVYSSKTLSVISQLLVGGTTSPSQDLSQFLKRSPNLVIATPGRLLELLASPHVHCPQSSFEVLVLDEADRLLDLGFKDDLQRILQRLPKQRRTGLFSASVSEAVDQLVRVGLRNPVRIAVKVKGKDGAEDQRTPARSNAYWHPRSLKMTYLTTAPSLKLPHLLNLILNLDHPPQKTIAYLSTCAAVDYFSHLLRSLLPLLDKDPASLAVIPLHGRQTAAHRNANLAKFTDSIEPTLLLTTDLASRGLDIPLVDLTVQLDPPSDPKTFLHRAGRAGRAGRRGLAVVFLTPGRESAEYPPFLAVRKTPVAPLADAQLLTTVAPSHGPAFAAAIRAAVRRDRALHDKAQRAFVSSVRAYSKHAARSIFRVAELDWSDLAEAWGLLRLPRMPELKRRSAATAGEDAGIGEAQPEEIDRSLGLKIDWDNFAYRDKQQEAKRRREMHEAQQSGAASANGPGPGGASASAQRKDGGNTAWSRRAAAHETAAARREKRASKREAGRLKGMSEEERRKEAELQSMVAEVRRRNMESREEFEGFSD